MEFGINKKIKVAFICQMSSEFVQDRLPLWKKSEFIGAWISNTVEGFKNLKDFEIHIISSHPFLKKNYSFNEDGISYHFYKSGIPILDRNWPRIFRLDVLTKFYCNRRKINKIVNFIKPDIINLHGAENAQYSLSILDLYKKYPVLVTIQGFVYLETSTREDRIRKIRVATEAKIIRNCPNFGGDFDSMRMIKEMRNSDFKFYNFYYPNGTKIDKLSEKKSDKDFDLLFWGRTIKDKGAEDFLILVSKLVADFPQLKACYIGPIQQQYQEFLRVRSIELGCESNIVFHGYLRSEEELYTEVLKSRILVLPTYNDRFPTVLREAVHFRIAVIGYATGSIPQFNTGDERILLSDQGDIAKLYTDAKKLLTDKSYFNSLTEKAFVHGIKEFSIENNCAKMAAAYYDILKIIK
ncbi:glycosyltransferase family 4 protein [Flavobacterium sp.]|jgi:glycosyltransferase involved in cell wall biosynthesis|uniref:glycosyltransferase family 4 protein n=1 Tax=Flavobacterium sp. TaxID=239 RepID=UPI0037BEFDFE